MLRRRQYIALYQTVEHTDPDTGRRKRVSVYIGPWYTLLGGEAAARRVKGALLALCAAGAALFITAGMLNSAGSRCFYVLPFYLLCLFPLFYWCWGAVRVFRLKPRFTEVDKDESLDRLRVSAVGAAILCGLHTLGELALILTGGAAGALPLEIVCAACMAAVGACALVSLRLLGGLSARREGDDAPKPDPST